MEKKRVVVVSFAGRKQRWQKTRNLFAIIDPWERGTKPPVLIIQ